MRKTNKDTIGIKRVLGEYDSGVPGPLLIVLAGIHGNEPSGLHAVRTVFEKLKSGSPAIHGRFVALGGNLKALRESKRFLKNDLNRIWMESHLGKLAKGELDPSDEDQELSELRQALENEIAEASGLIVLLDLHSTSGYAPPFSIISDTIQNRRIAFASPIPVVLGLEESIEGTTLSYFGERGLVAVGIEGGRHEDPLTIDHHESSVWLALEAGGLLTEDQIPDVGRHREKLRSATSGLPRVVEIIHRHGLRPGEGISMVDGLRNFDHIEKGVLLAHDDEGKEVHSPEKGLLLLPRYQGLGDDGFFIGQPVSLFWLRLSAMLRRLKLDYFLAYLPGVHHHDKERDLLLADPSVARWFTVQIFHLLGFRRRKPRGKHLVFSRRPEGRVNGTEKAR